MPKPDTSRTAPDGSPLALLVGGAVAFLGAFVLCGWYVRTLKLVSLAELYVPMQATTAVGFMAVGLSVMAHCMGWRRCAFWGGTVAAGVGSLALAETTLGQSELFTRALSVGVPMDEGPGHTSAITAVCIALSGCLFISYGAPTVSRRWRQTTTSIVGAVIVAAGCAGLLSYVADPHSSSWAHVLLVGDLKTAAGFVGIGVAFFLMAGHFRDQTMPSALPAWTTGAIVAALTLGLWMTLTSHDAALRRTALAWARQATVDHLDRSLDNHLRALERIVVRHDRLTLRREAANGDGARLMDVDLLMEDVPGLLGAGVMHRSGLGQVVEAPGQEGALLLALRTAPALGQAVLAAQRSGRSAITEPLRVGASPPCLFVVIPRARARGSVVFRHEIDPFLDHLLGHRVISVFDVEIMTGSGLPFYRTREHIPIQPSDQHGPAANLQVTGDVAVGEMLWQVSVASAESWVAGRRNVANTLILWFGLFLSVAIAVVVHKTKVLREHAAAMEDAKATIETNAASLKDANRSLRLQTAHLVKAEAQIRRTDTEKRRVLDSLSAFVIAVDTEGRVVEWNRVARDLFGLDAREKLFEDLELPWDRARMSAAVTRCVTQGRREKLDHVPLRVPWDEDKRFVGLTISPTLDERGGKGFSIIGADVTAKLQLEAQLHQAQRMEAVGTLAAGIAHEINTPMQYVGDNLRFIAEQLGPVTDVLRQAPGLAAAARDGTLQAADADRLEQALEKLDVDFVAEELPRALEETLEGAERVATIVRAMKKFSHPGQQGRQTADLNEAIRTTLEVARNEYKYHADVITELGELPLVECYLADLNQVFLNLLVNAAHAIADRVETGEVARGTITISTRHDGDWVEISVSDTGTGIPEGARARVFDQFFTTKEPGRGTGQGLALCWSVVKDKHGGTLSFETQEGQGTTFLVRVPIKAPNPECQASEPREEEARPVRG